MDWVVAAGHGCLSSTFCAVTYLSQQAWTAARDGLNSACYLRNPTVNVTVSSEVPVLALFVAVKRFLKADYHFKSYYCDLVNSTEAQLVFKFRPVVQVYQRCEYLILSC